MLFNSLEFLIFFPVVTLLYFLLPHRWRWLHLLIASCIFYMFFIPVYILILIFTIIIDYIAGILIEDAQGSRRKLYLMMSLVANIGVLAVFKYYNFFIGNVNEMLHHIGMQAHNIPLLNIILPIGLSFHTFQAMSYTIEVYRGHQPAERHFGIYSLYVMFYPQLVAGPIERPQNLLWQFREEHHFDYRQVVSGLRLMAWGMFKKVVIADRLCILVNGVYNDPQHYHGVAVILAMIFFSIQIYCDFSGYSDIAIGSARVMGFHLMRNFNRPYFSKTIAEFWKRWHISLSTWFKDYLYISLGGNRVARWKWYRNIFIVFMVSGLWHGANWTFIVWGALHGIYQIAGSLLEPVKKRLREMAHVSEKSMWYRLQQMTVIFVLVTVAWVFFRANTFSDAFTVLQHSVMGLGSDISTIIHTHKIFQVIGYFKGIELLDWMIIPVALALLLAVDKMQSHVGMQEWFSQRSPVLRWCVYFAAVYGILFFGKFEETQFIYFQF
ncbi:MAG: MBOAT family O-acyltransferase [Chitinophagales bacterium]